MGWCCTVLTEHLELLVREAHALLERRADSRVHLQHSQHPMLSLLWLGATMPLNIPMNKMEWCAKMDGVAASGMSALTPMSKPRLQEFSAAQAASTSTRVGINLPAPMAAPLLLLQHSPFPLTSPVAELWSAHASGETGCRSRDGSSMAATHGASTQQLAHISGEVERSRRATIIIGGVPARSIIYFKTMRYFAK